MGNDKDSSKRTDEKTEEECPANPVETPSEASVPPRAVASGFLWGRVECNILDDGTRVITERGVLWALRGIEPSSGTEAGSVKQYLARLPKRYGHLAAEPNITFALPGGELRTGYTPAHFLGVLRAYVEARDTGELPSTEEPMAKRAAEVLGRFVDKGIAATIDDACGGPLATMPASEVPGLGVGGTDPHKALVTAEMAATWLPNGNRRPQTFRTAREFYDQARDLAEQLKEALRCARRHTAGDAPTDLGRPLPANPCSAAHRPPRRRREHNTRRDVVMDSCWRPFLGSGRLTPHLTVVETPPAVASRCEVMSHARRRYTTSLKSLLGSYYRVEGSTEATVELHPVRPMLVSESPPNASRHLAAQDAHAAPPAPVTAAAAMPSVAPAAPPSEPAPVLGVAYAQNGEGATITLDDKTIHVYVFMAAVLSWRRRRGGRSDTQMTARRWPIASAKTGPPRWSRGVTMPS